MSGLWRVLGAGEVRVVGEVARPLAIAGQPLMSRRCHNSCANTRGLYPRTLTDVDGHRRANHVARQRNIGQARIHKLNTHGHLRTGWGGLKIRTVSVRVRLGVRCVTDARGDQLILFTDGLGVGLAIRIKHVLAAIQPRRLDLGVVMSQSSRHRRVISRMSWGSSSSVGRPRNQ